MSNEIDWAALHEQYQKNFMEPHPERLPTHPDWQGDPPKVDTQEEEATGPFRRPQPQEDK